MTTTIAQYLRQAIFACMALPALLVAPIAGSQSIALTFDDGPNMADNTGLTTAERNRAILAQLADAHLKSILFVTRTDTNTEKNDLIRAWGAAGHQIGNHTAAHPNFAEVSRAEFEHEFKVCDQVIRPMLGFTPRFRFPYLHEGETVEKRDGFRAFLEIYSPFLLRTQHAEAPAKLKSVYFRLIISYRAVHEFFMTVARQTRRATPALNMTSRYRPTPANSFSSGTPCIENPLRDPSAANRV